jgi:hypothetical protein
MCATYPAHFILPNCITLITSERVQHKVWKFGYQAYVTRNIAFEMQNTDTILLNQNINKIN